MRISIALVLLGGCASGGLVESDEVVPAFALPDVNPTSPTTGRDVAPGDHLGRVSAWYFGHAT